MTTKESLSTKKQESYKIFDDIAATYDSLNHTLSMGIDIYWRKQMLKYLPEGDVKALDLATGTGDVALTLSKHPRIKSIEGLDMSQEMIAIGRKKVLQKNLADKIDLQIGDGVHIPKPDSSFNLITISFGIRNFPDVATSLKNCYRVLQPNGKLMIMEFSIPKNPIIKWLYFLYFRHILPFIGNIVSGHKDAYSYLNQTVEDFPYGSTFALMIKQAGFSKVIMRTLTFGIATLYIAEKE